MYIEVYLRSKLNKATQAFSPVQSGSMSTEEDSRCLGERQRSWLVFLDSRITDQGPLAAAMAAVASST